MQKQQNKFLYTKYTQGSPLEEYNEYLKQLLLPLPKTKGKG